MCPRKPLLLLVLAALLSAGITHAAPIYKWRDAEGGIHYEDTRPPEGEVQVITPPNVYRGEASDQAGAAGSASGDGERERKCTESRERLAEGQAASRMYTLDASGNRTYLSATEIEAHIAKLREAVSTWCGEP